MNSGILVVKIVLIDSIEAISEGLCMENRSIVVDVRLTMLDQYLVYSLLVLWQMQFKRLPCFFYGLILVCDSNLECYSRLVR